MESSYQYMSLRTRDAIRLVELSPGSPDTTAIHLTLRHTSLQASRSIFEAVSYVWGSETFSKPIFCGENRSKLFITANCYTALYHLRHEHKTRTLWIDSICINQSDISERNAQVQIMGSIFTAAQRVIVFLGESNYGSRLLFQHLTKADSWINSGYHGCLLRPSQEIINQLSHLFSRPWFSRIWVVQELVNSNETLFMCGSDLATETALMSCLYGYEENTRVIFHFPPPIELKDAYSRRLLASCTSPIQEMYILVATTSHSRSTDPRDRILALTPLITTKTSRLRRLIDYNRSIETLFEEFSILLLSEVKLLLLYMIRHPNSRDLPSWVPDWSQDAPRGRSWANLPELFTMVHAKTHDDFALGQLDQSIDGREPPWRTLTVKGMRYGRISKTSPIIQIGSASVVKREHAVIELLEAVSSLRLGNALPQWPDSISQALQQVTIEDVYMLLADGGYPADFTVDEEVVSNIADTCDNCVIFVTIDGKLGVAPKEIQEGDILCVIKGALKPCIFREKTIGYWNIISGYCTILDFKNDFLQRCMTDDINEFEYLLEIISEPMEEFCIY